MIIMDTLSNNSIQLKELDKKDLFRKKKILLDWPQGAGYLFQRNCTDSVSADNAADSAYCFYRRSARQSYFQSDSLRKKQQAV